MKINTKYNFGDIVYLKTDKSQKPHIVTGVLIRDNVIEYGIKLEKDETWHYTYELTSQVNEVLKLS